MVGEEGKVLVITAPGSAGKSSLAKLICDRGMNFVKLNTKSIRQQTLKEFNKDFFKSELEASSKIYGEKIEDVMTLFSIGQNSKDSNFLPIYKKAYKKAQDIRGKFFYYLYRNYYKETKKITSNSQNCVIDHNIFLDPYPMRSVAFLDSFAPYGKNIKILNLFSNFEKCLQNTFKRNNDFINFVRGFSSAEQAENEIQKTSASLGYSALEYRQPMMILETWALMYNFTTNKPNEKETVYQRISGRHFKAMLRSSIYEQEKLMGFFIYKRYPFYFPAPKNIGGLSNDFQFLEKYEDYDNLYIVNNKHRYDFILKDFNNNIELLRQSKDFEDFEAWLNGWITPKRLTKSNHSEHEYSSLGINIEEPFQIQDLNSQKSINTFTLDRSKEVNFDNFIIYNSLNVKSNNIDKEIAEITQGICSSSLVTVVCHILDSGLFINYAFKLRSDNKLDFFYLINNELNVVENDEILVFICKLYIALRITLNDKVDINFIEKNYKDFSDLRKPLEIFSRILNN